MFLVMFAIGIFLLSVVPFYRIYHAVKRSSPYSLPLQIVKRNIEKDVHSEIILALSLVVSCVLFDIIVMKLLWNIPFGLFSIFPAGFNMLYVLTGYIDKENYIERCLFSPHWKTIYKIVIKDIRNNPESWWRRAYTLLDSLARGELSYDSNKLLPLILAMKYYRYSMEIPFKYTFSIPRFFKKHPYYSEFKSHVKRNVKVIDILHKIGIDPYQENKNPKNHQ